MPPKGRMVFWTEERLDEMVRFTDQREREVLDAVPPVARQLLRAKAEMPDEFVPDVD